MGRVLVDLLPFTVIGIASPGALMAEIVILTTKLGLVNAWLFVLGWFLGMLAVGWVLLLFSDGVAYSPSSGSSTFGGVLQLLAGALFLGLAALTWRRSAAQVRSGHPPKPPRWLQGFGNLSGGRALGLGALLGTVLAPANLIADLTAVGHIVEADLGQGQRYVTYLIFSVFSLIGGIAPVLIATLLGERARGRLDNAQAWLMTHSDAVTLGVLGVFGFLFVSKGLGALIV